VGGKEGKRKGEGRDREGQGRGRGWAFPLFRPSLRLWAQQRTSSRYLEQKRFQSI
jgi:hypothetical protein